MPMARNTSSSNAQRDGCLRDCALLSAEFTLPATWHGSGSNDASRLNRHSPVAEGDISARGLPPLEWSARYWCAEPSRDYEEFVGAKKHRDPSRGFMALGP